MICSIAARLRGAGTAGFSITRLSGACCVEEGHELVQLAGDRVEIDRFPGGDVEQGAGVSGGGGTASHDLRGATDGDSDACAEFHKRKTAIYST